MPDTTTEPPPPPIQMDPWGDGTFPTNLHFDAYRRNMELQAKRIVEKFEREKNTPAAKSSLSVYSLDECFERIKFGPFNFTTILGTNAQILNDFFEYQLRHAREGTHPEAVINSALRAQGQLVRTLNTLVRYENFQNGGQSPAKF